MALAIQRLCAPRRVDCVCAQSPIQLASDTALAASPPEQPAEARGEAACCHGESIRRHSSARLIRGQSLLPARHGARDSPHLCGAHSQGGGMAVTHTNAHGKPYGVVSVCKGGTE